MDRYNIPIGLVRHEATWTGGIDFSESILGLLKFLKIRAQGGKVSLCYKGTGIHKCMPLFKYNKTENSMSHLFYRDSRVRCLVAYFVLSLVLFKNLIYF